MLLTSPPRARASLVFGVRSKTGKPSKMTSRCTSVEKRIRRQKWAREKSVSRAAYERETDENALDNIQRRQRNQRDVRRDANPLMTPPRLRNANASWANEAEFFDDQRRGYENNNSGGGGGGPKVPPRWQNVLKKYILNPYGIFAIVAMISISHAS